jgi:hypothetical protein
MRRLSRSDGRCGADQAAAIHRQKGPRLTRASRPHQRERTLNDLAMREGGGHAQFPSLHARQISFEAVFCLARFDLVVQNLSVGK